MSDKRHELSEFDRGRIVGAHDAGMSERQIVEMYDFSKTTVHRVINDFEEYGITKPAPRSGRPPKLDDDDKSSLVQIVEKDHRAPLARITAQMRDVILDDISERTIQRTLHTEGYFGRVGVRKPFVSDTNRIKRLEWANERKNWSSEWDFVIWSDESRYEISGDGRRKWVWRRPEQKMDVDCLIPTFKSGNKSVMVWGCFTRSGVGPLVRLRGRLAAQDYVQVLESNLLPFLEGLKRKKRFVFQEDNAPIHTSTKSKKWKADNGIPCLPWPAQSPDLNPIEHLWDELERRLRQRDKPPKNEDELFEILLDEWKKIPKSVLENLVDSMPNRVQGVRKAEGYSTKY
jgi:transposase